MPVSDLGKVRLDLGMAFGRYAEADRRYRAGSDPFRQIAIVYQTELVADRAARNLAFGIALAAACAEADRRRYRAPVVKHLGHLGR